MFIRISNSLPSLYGRDFTTSHIFQDYLLLSFQVIFLEHIFCLRKLSCNLFLCDGNISIFLIAVKS